MIRNVVLGRLRPGVPADEVERALQALRDLTVEGVDEEAYRTYDRDAEHNRIRAEMFAPSAP